MFSSQGSVFSRKNEQASFFNQTQPVLVAANGSPCAEASNCRASCRGSGQEQTNLQSYISETSGKKHLHFKSKHFITDWGELSAH